MRKILSGVAAIAVLGLVSVANAEYTGNCIEITASANGHTASAAWATENMYWDDETKAWEWSLSSDYDLTDDSGNVLGTVKRASVTVYGDPAINLSFSVQAGSSDTLFTITSGLLSFPTINSPQGLAGAGFTITDTNNDGATLTPQNASGSAYSAQYNGQAPGGTSFAELINAAITANPGKSNSASDNYPAVGYAAIGTPVSDMSAQVSFTATAKDLASGTNNYEIIPEPAAFVLLALGGLGLFRRR